MSSTSTPVTVVDSATGATTLAQTIANLQPDVVVWELEAPDDQALSALSNLDLSASGALAIVILVEDPSGAWTAEAIRSGVRAVLAPETTANELVAAVEAAAAGLVVLQADLAELWLNDLPPSPRPNPVLLQALTPREIEVLQMLAEGLGNKTIARRMSISEHTVKFHVSSIFNKLNASSRTEAVTLGARQGLILL
ncbi:response regulator transcription factor [Leptolyngbya sp. FACHB-261]|nr:response regulator transcription factor [Leptolyngbya sp. FACHB-261]